MNPLRSDFAVSATIATMSDRIDAEVGTESIEASEDMTNADPFNPETCSLSD
jgi:hypothetical protein